MNTHVVSPKDILQVSSCLNSGGVVAVPTETVYGLAARADNADAVAKIFEVKGRPSDNPLIVHVNSIEQGFSLLKNLPNYALDLAKNYWPGPLTLVGESAVDWPWVQAGHTTLAIRFPSHPFLQELISHTGPLAAPSANLSGKPSPTTAAHCLVDLEGKFPFIVDGGTCDVGIESTVVDCTKESPIILRAGAVTSEMIQEVATLSSKESFVASPGTKHPHYKPCAKVDVVTLIPSHFEEDTLYILSEDVGQKNVRTYSSPSHLAKNLFAWFREADQLGFKRVIVQEVSEEGIGAGVMNRLRKAAKK